jgi:hypothetical protein
VSVSCRNLGQFTVQRKLSLDEATILWSGHLKLRAYNPEKIKYGMLVRIVCRASSDIHNVEIYAAERKNLIKISGKTIFNSMKLANRNTSLWQYEG